MAERPTQMEDRISERTVTIERIMAVLGTVIMFSPRGIGGCSTSSGVSDIQDLVTIRLPHWSIINVGTSGPIIN